MFACINFEENVVGQKIGEEENNIFIVENLMKIISKDVDYNDFNYFYPDFKPNLIKYYKLTKTDYSLLRQEWFDEDKMRIYVPIIDEINLTQSTYFVEFDSLDNNKYGLVAIIDIDKNQSLKIVSKINVKMGN